MMKLHESQYKTQDPRSKESKKEKENFRNMENL